MTSISKHCDGKVRVPSEIHGSTWLDMRVSICIAALCGAPIAKAEPLSSDHYNATVEGPSLKSMLDFRDENLIRQQYDYSCGAAALATLLRFGLDDPVTEQQIGHDLLFSDGIIEPETQQSRECGRAAPMPQNGAAGNSPDFARSPSRDAAAFVAALGAPPTPTRR